MNWLGAGLTTDQSDLVSMLDVVVAKSSFEPDMDEARQAEQFKTALVDADAWTLGTAPEHGGAGGSFDLRQIALATLGRSRAGAAWASNQAHTAVDVLGAAGRLDAADAVHGGKPVAVVELASTAVELELAADGLRGRLWRIDPAAENADVLVLVGDQDAWFLPSASVHTVSERRRTGMPGALTITADVAVDRSKLIELTDLPLAAIRSRFRFGAAAIAAGLAIESATRAIEYSKSRVQFGGPLTQLPTVQSSLFAQTQLALESFRLAMETDPSPFDAAAVLAGNCERAITVGAMAVQSHGGYGYITEYGVEGLLRDAISLRAVADVQRATRAAAALLVGAGDGSLADRTEETR